MDSGNSGSVQSSSGGGGDEEYDSHGGSISTFLNSSAHFGSISSNPLPQFLSHQPTLFDPHDSQNFNSNFQDSANSLYNNDLLWPKSLGSDNNFNNFGNLNSSSSSATNHAILGTNTHVPNYNSIPIKSSIDHQPNVGKNPKKRSRASRRAPTTVLTTDTTNFRQMVQEFTGIPTTPFTGSAYTRRLDLFSTATSAIRSGHLDNLGPLFTLRPSTQKVQDSPIFMPPSSSALNNSMFGRTNASTSDIGISKQAQNKLFNMQNDQIQSFSTSEFHPEKGFENYVCSAGEGTVGSWTCPSG
nr:epsin-like [Nicotiana tomentosiformis]